MLGEGTEPTTPPGCAPAARATLADLPEIVALVNRAYRGDEARQGWTTEADLLDGQRLDEELLREQITAENSEIWLWRSATQRPAAQPCALQACVQLTQHGELAHLGMLTVAPKLQNAGIGRVLLRWCEQHLSRRGVRRLEMCVLSVRSELIAWYQRRGFVLTAERRPFPMQDPRFGLPKVARLEFVVLEKSLAAV